MVAVLVSAVLLSIASIYLTVRSELTLRRVGRRLSEVEARPP